MAENPLGHEINVATDEEILSFLAGSYPATNTDKLRNRVMCTLPTASAGILVARIDRRTRHGQHVYEDVVCRCVDVMSSVEPAEGLVGCEDPRW